MIMLVYLLVLLSILVSSKAKKNPCAPKCGPGKICKDGDCFSNDCGIDGSLCPDDQICYICKTNPCSVSKCNVENAICKDSYCDSCHAEWFDLNNSPISPHDCGNCGIDGSYCPSGVCVTCFGNPCDLTTCNVPNAICKENYCDSCGAHYFDINGNPLTTEQCNSGNTQCTDEAKLCDDGITTVSRNPSLSCEFDECPPSFDSACAAVLCASCTTCVDGKCIPLCDIFEDCNYEKHQCEDKYKQCGGIAGLPCDGTDQCLFVPEDECKADCFGTCARTNDDGGDLLTVCHNIGTTDECPEDNICFTDPVPSIGICAEPRLTWNALKRQLISNKNNFNSHNIDDYTYSIRMGGFLHLCNREKKIITVDNGILTDIKYEDDTLDCTDDDILDSDRKTINEWFDLLIDNAEECNLNPSSINHFCGLLDIEYDPQYEFIISISHNVHEIIHDGGSFYYFGDFVPLSIPSSNTNWDNLKNELINQQNIFNSYNFEDYTYSIERGACLCPVCWTAKKHHIVNSGKVVDIFYDDNELDCDKSDLFGYDYRTINGWFKELITKADQCILNVSPDECDDTIDIEYDDVYGYMTKITYNEKYIPVDGGIIYYFGDLYEIYGLDTTTSTTTSSTSTWDILCWLSDCGPCSSCSEGHCDSACAEYEQCNDGTNQCEPISYETCGGIHNIQCNDGYECIDDPRDFCDPECNIGADCGGICAKIWNDGSGNKQSCDGLLGLQCPDGFMCFNDPSDSCNINCGGADCIGFCAAPISD